MLDLIIFTVFTIVFEAIATYASGTWFWAQAVNISVTLLLVCIVMMRWGGWAAIQAVAGGLVYCFAAGATTEQYIVYSIGNLFGLVALLLIRFVGKEKIRASKMQLVLLATITYIGMAIGKTVVGLIFGGTVSDFVLYVTTDIISLLFAAVVLVLLRKTDGMIEDQKAYLFRVEREEREEAKIQEENEIIL
jgi:hypothetical protein